MSGQLAFLVDALEDDLDEAQRVAVEAAIEYQDQERAAGARFARPCRCSRPWLLAPGWCVKCGHQTTITGRQTPK